ncbi:hypothetical protein AK812_SmicGene7948 [Symbiodinium microadriaticum]|uniref:Uncharacterized protein n=1 Tax=Symbiodinium microadriaticum TaxID=2951 RepID=A0A1Q9EM86_SYMMI|nr:hypothetical protein AK812_SmicGene7948 [Symbiodinium microadriaticum]
MPPFQATPLHLAAVAGHDHIVALLVEAGADTVCTAGPQQASRGHVSVLRALRQQRVQGDSRDPEQAAPKNIL